MNCGSCGTRVGVNDPKCPNCGRNLEVRGENEPKPTSVSTSPLSPSSAKMPTKREGLRQPEKDERSTASKPAETTAPRKPKTARSNRASVKRVSKKSAPAAPAVVEEVVMDEAIEEEDEIMAGGVVGSEEIRAILSERPDCLEDGLSIFTDAKARPVGLDYETDMGAIDLLAVDDAGGLVLVLTGAQLGATVADSGKELVSCALERVGWIRKHVASKGQEVRAMVLLDRAPEDLCYSAAAVAETVSFKTCRLEISFCDVEI